MQLRPGGTVVNNLFVRNSIALCVGGGNNPDPGGVTADVRGNVILDGKDIDAANPRGWGMWFGNIASGAWRTTSSPTTRSARSRVVMTLDGTTRATARQHRRPRLRDRAENVLFDWGGAIVLVEGKGQPDHRASSCVNNDLQETVRAQALSCTPIPPAPAACARTRTASTVAAPSPPGRPPRGAFPDPRRGPASFDALHGGAGTLASFLARARAQSKSDWRPECTAAALNRHVREGFALEFE